MLADLQAIVLAAGKSTQLSTGRTKLIEKICGRELILYATTLLERINIPTTVVVGYQREHVQDIIKKYHANSDQPIHFVVQEEQHGTGHAILCARDSWHKDHILIMNGDVPLVTPEIIETLYKHHHEERAAISFVMAHNSDPSSFSYGRVIKEGNNTKIIEAHEFNSELHEHCCINAGIYIVAKRFLEENINEIERNETSKEFYITDLVKIASSKNYPITSIATAFDVIRGINTFQELWAVEQIKRAELIKYWMENGVRFTMAQTVHIDLDVTIGAGTVIGSGVHLLNSTHIGNNCTIEPFSIIDRSIIEDDTIIYANSVIEHTHIGHHAQVGPFAHIRNNSILAEYTTIGNFVEVKQSTIAPHTKAKHLSYIGDAQIGSHVNIGAGTITCNHNGVSKQKTIIEDRAYIGSNNSLVAPVTIKQNAFTAAGSVITEDVPVDALAIARSRQINKPGYAKKIREYNEQKDTDEDKKESTPRVSFIGAIKLDSDTNIK